MFSSTPDSKRPLGVTVTVSDVWRTGGPSRLFSPPGAAVLQQTPETQLRYQVCEMTDGETDVRGRLMLPTVTVLLPLEEGAGSHFPSLVSSRCFLFVCSFYLADLDHVELNSRALEPRALPVCSVCLFANWNEFGKGGRGHVVLRLLTVGSCSCSYTWMLRRD